MVEWWWFFRPAFISTQSFVQEKGGVAGIHDLLAKRWLNRFSFDDKRKVKREAKKYPFIYELLNHCKRKFLKIRCRSLSSHHTYALPVPLCAVIVNIIIIIIITSLCRSQQSKRQYVINNHNGFYWYVMWIVEAGWGSGHSKCISLFCCDFSSLFWQW